MATKKAKMVTPKGILVFPAITKEDEYEGVKTGKYKAPLKLNPADPGVQAWMDRTEADINERIDAYLADLKKTDKKKFNIQSKYQRTSPFKPIYDDEGNETGEVKVTFNRKVEKGIAKVIDSAKNVIKNPQVTGGSTVKIAYGMGKAYGMAAHKMLGVPLYLNIVQLIELASFGSSVDDFDEEEGYVDDGAGDQTDDFDDESGEEEEDF